jgi:hypothetical protein
MTDVERKHHSAYRTLRCRDTSANSHDPFEDCAEGTFGFVLSDKATIMYEVNRRVWQLADLRTTYVVILVSRGITGFW